ncbi:MULTISPECIES: SOS response-associated peptidase [unclassified Leucobacter]|uniref:SOS response-associated peptidase n=1 Tax=unclassified Leucobacter TaxID=2621730 RepID=UPI003017E047
MCGRVIVDYDENMDVAGGSELAKWLMARPTGYEPSWNVKPTQQIPVALTSTKDGAKRFEMAHWSLVPPWAKEMKSRYPTFNARSEQLSEKATFKGPLKRQRCVIPVTGFYEWTGPKTARTPHAIFGLAQILPMAGLYSWWREPDAAESEGWHLTATILTRASAGVMESLHDRMPVFMAEELVRDWLDPETEGDQLLVDAVSEASIPISEQLREWAVRPLRGDGPELIEPA